MDTLFTKLQNMENYDYHVFMEVLLPIAFNALPTDALEPLLALFINLCANVFYEDLLMEMHRNIGVILCKLKTIFLPEIWNVMEHFLVHLAQEAYLGSPVHYWWMCSLERLFHLLKQKANNKFHPHSSTMKLSLMYEVFDIWNWNIWVTLFCPQTSNHDANNSKEWITTC